MNPSNPGDIVQLSTASGRLIEPLPPKTRACCLPDHSCQDLLEAECLAQGGVWQGFRTTCDTFECPQAVGACCFLGSVCYLRTSDECFTQGGIYQGDDTPCAPNPCVVPGDLNCDGGINFGDINPFVLILSNPTGWQGAYPGCPFLNGDINGDGRVNFGDINPFVALLSSK
jgi:hypothetical protein